MELRSDESPKLNFLHRWFGTAIFLTVNLHMLSYSMFAYFPCNHRLTEISVWKWVDSITESPSTKFQEMSNIYGLIATTGVEMLFFTSLSFVRHRWFAMFLFSHIFGLILFSVFVSIKNHYGLEAFVDSSFAALSSRHGYSLLDHCWNRILCIGPFTSDFQNPSYDR